MTDWPPGWPAWTVTTVSCEFEGEQRHFIAGPGISYRLEVRLAVSDVGSRVVIRWRQPGEAGDGKTADVVGVLEAAGAASFAIRKSSGELVVVPRERALAGKTVPPPRRPRRTSGDSAA